MLQLSFIEILLIIQVVAVIFFIIHDGKKENDYVYAFTQSTKVVLFPIYLILFLSVKFWDFFLFPIKELFYGIYLYKKGQVKTSIIQSWLKVYKANRKNKFFFKRWMYNIFVFYMKKKGIEPNE